MDRVSAYGLACFLEECAKVENRKTVMDEAKDLIYGDRQESYGHPREDFKRVAVMWSTIIGADVKPEQIPLCMIALKISRQCNRPKHDNLVDICGYAGTLEMMEDDGGEG